MEAVLPFFLERMGNGDIHTRGSVNKRTLKRLQIKGLMMKDVQDRNFDKPSRGIFRNGWIHLIRCISFPKERA